MYAMQTIIPPARALLEMAERCNPPSHSSDPDFGDVAFDAGDGWTVVIFYDCGELDYIAHFVTPEGVEIDFWEWGEDEPGRQDLINWSGVGTLARWDALAARRNGHDTRS